MGSRGSSRRRRAARDFYHTELIPTAAAKAEAYLGVGNGGDNDKWKESLDDVEINDFVRYSDSDYGLINEVWREKNNVGIFREYYTIADSMANSLGRQTINVDLMTHRGDNGAVFGLNDNSDKDTVYNTIKNLVGSEFSFGGFVSTSPVRPWRNHVQYHIKINKGKTKGAYIDEISYNKGERELLLHPDTKFRIDKVVKPKHGTNGAFVDVYMTAK